MPKNIGSYAKLTRLKEIIAPFKKVTLAFSGGLDSSFLLWVLRDCLEPVSITAVTFKSATTPAYELKTAGKTAAYLGVTHKVLKTPEFQCDDFVNNDLLRCYYCKRERFTFLLSDESYKNTCIMEGSNMDDLLDYRPGMKAAQELGVLSPLLKAQIYRKDIEKICTDMKLPFKDLKSESCLATRIRTGQKLDINLLKKIEAAEDFIKSKGISFIRVRFDNNDIRLEVNQEEIEKVFDDRDDITRFLKELGFNRISLDLEGYGNKG